MAGRVGEGCYNERRAETGPYNTMTTKETKRWTAERSAELTKKLPMMGVGELQALWEELFGGVCYSRSAVYLRERLVWRLSALVCGGISERARERAEEIVDERLLSRCVKPCLQKGGEQAVRQETIRKRFRGEVHVVHCNEYGFEYRGARFNSLSAVATHIAGYHVSCTKFFGVKGGKNKK